MEAAAKWQRDQMPPPLEPRGERDGRVRLETLSGRQLHALAITVAHAWRTSSSPSREARQDQAFASANQILIYDLILRLPHRPRAVGAQRALAKSRARQSGQLEWQLEHGQRNGDEGAELERGHLEPLLRSDRAEGKQLEPEARIQLEEFNSRRGGGGGGRPASAQLNRTRLARLVQLRRKLHRWNQCASFGGPRLERALYALERLAREFNASLAHTLAATSERALAAMLAAHSAAQSRPAHPKSPPSPARRARLAQLRATCAHNSSRDSGIELAPEGDDERRRRRQGFKRPPRGGRRDEWRTRRAPLEPAHWLAMRSSCATRAIVAYSCALFAQLLSSSRLLNLHLQQQQQHQPAASLAGLSLQQLKVFACVESQQLRARLRCEWLPRCVELWAQQLDQLGARGSAIGSSASYSKVLAACQSDACCEPLPGLGAAARATDDEQFELELELEAQFGQLAALMGHLLRRHFLLEAFERWLAALANSLIGRPAPGQRAQLELRVELATSRPAAKSTLFAGCPAPTPLSPGEEHLEAGQCIKQALGFVCLELASACERLPRLEQELTEAVEATKKRASIKPAEEPKKRWLPVLLGPGDDLVAQTLLRLNKLIDDCLAGAKARLFGRTRPRPGDKHEAWLQTFASGQTPPSPNWALDASYAFVIQVLNHFRSANSAQSERKLEAIFKLMEPGGLEAADQKFNGQQEETVDEQLAQLRRARKQIKLLDELALLLATKMERHFRFGHLIQLDCEPLRRSLCKLVASERALLVRLKSDELIKLMERLRLQFDELELRIDLEVAVEDYLNERWRAKQSQQLSDLEQDLLLDMEESSELPMVAPPVVQSESEEADEHEHSHPVAPTTEPELGTAGLLDGRQPSGGDASRLTFEDEQEEELINALTNNNNPNVAQMFTLSRQQQQPSGASKANSSGQVSRPVGEIERQIGDRVAPLIECKLLVERYAYLRDFLLNELAQLKVDMRTVFEGLLFLSEDAVPVNCAPARGWPIGLEGGDSTSNERHDYADSFYQDEDESESDKQQMDIINDLSRRASEFQWLLEESLDRLESSRQRLLASNCSRSRVLSSTVLEFDCLMGALSRKRIVDPIAAELHPSRAPKTAHRSHEAGRARDEATSIKQLDAIQNISSLAQKLQMRLEFLRCQNEFINREQILLYDGANLGSELSELTLKRTERTTVDAGGVSEIVRRHEFELRAGLLRIWQPNSSLLAQFWRLAEQFETQQVKWLNSDSKRINYNELETQFEQQFINQLESLRRQVLVELGSLPDSLEPAVGLLEVAESIKETMLANIGELSLRLNRFRDNMLPVFEFITSKNLTNEHWHQLSSILNSRRDTTVERHLAPDNYTTVAQLLELDEEFETSTKRQDLQGCGEFIKLLEELTHKAAIEHELTALLLAEASRAEKLGPNVGSSTTRTIFHLENWTREELIAAAGRFIETKLQAASLDGHLLVESSDERRLWANRLVSCYLSVCRLTKLEASLNLDLQTDATACRADAFRSDRDEITQRHEFLLLKSAPRLNGRHQLKGEEQSMLFIEFLRLFCDWLVSDHRDLNEAIIEARSELSKIEVHCEEIDQLLGQVAGLKGNQLQEVIQSNESSLSQLERDCLNLEMEREILANREALGLDKQREAISRRDDCVRQITERAIPALRAASKSLDCLGDGKSLRSLRSLRPSPPITLRLVIEPVCLLRNWAVGAQSTVFEGAASKGAPPAGVKYPTEAMRKFDPLSGHILEDYWPIAWRTLNGLHSFQLLKDLRQRVNGHLVEARIMRLIRRKYLARKEFSVRAIENISKDCAHLARWLLAVDVFNRVLEVVRPNYAQYLKSEREVGEQLASLTKRRQQIEQISERLDQSGLEIRERIRQKNSLVELVADCSQQSAKIQTVRLSLGARHERLKRKLANIEAKCLRLVSESAQRAAHFLFIGNPKSERKLPRIIAGASSNCQDAEIKTRRRATAIERLITLELTSNGKLDWT